jgi:SAM-dependent methyltransferase
VLHLQCRSGDESLALARRGASVVGVDRSRPDILDARALATDLGLADRSRFIIADLYDLRHTLPEPESFDVVYSTGGGIGRLPDIAEWARIVEWYLKPGGALYIADARDPSLEADVSAALVAAGLVVDFEREHDGPPRAWSLGARRAVAAVA